jgi:oligopeptide transport system ATP-binding protein
MKPILEVNNLVTRFYTNDGVVHAVNGVSFKLHEGETLAVVGESGSGKSVSMMSLLGLVPEPPGKIESGAALFGSGEEKRDLLRLSRAQLRRVRGKEIGFIFQDPLSSLNPLLTIGRQINEALVEHLGLSERAARAQVVALLEHVGIAGAKDRVNNYPHQFSGGMRQRVMIAMAIACSPKIIIADEPTTALDVTVQAQIIDLMARLQEEMGIAVIWITHDLGVVAGIADRVLVMYGGMITEAANVDNLYKRPQHPYTIGLLGALPRLDTAGNGRLISIEGSPPDLFSPPHHCPFARRCPYAFERCWQEIPPDYHVGERQRVACFFDVESGKERP